MSLRATCCKRCGVARKKAEFPPKGALCAACNRERMMDLYRARKARNGKTTARRGPKPMGTMLRRSVRERQWAPEMSVAATSPARERIRASLARIGWDGRCVA